MEIIILGDIVSGFRFIGLFESVDDAIDWAEINVIEHDWHITSVESPDDVK